jgi:hypothetical protein
MLVAIRDYIARRGLVSLQELSMHFQVEAEAMREMLAHWLRKGKLQRHAAGSACGGCSGSCNSAVTEFYRWTRAACPRAPSAAEARAADSE